MSIVCSFGGYEMLEDGFCGKMKKSIFGQPDIYPRRSPSMAEPSFYRCSIILPSREITFAPVDQASDLS